MKWQAREILHFWLRVTLTGLDQTVKLSKVKKLNSARKPSYVSLQGLNHLNSHEWQRQNSRYNIKQANDEDEEDSNDGIIR